MNEPSNLCWKDCIFLQAKSGRERQIFWNAESISENNLERHYSRNLQNVATGFWTEASFWASLLFWAAKKAPGAFASSCRNAASFWLIRSISFSEVFLWRTALVIGSKRLQGSPMSSNSLRLQNCLNIYLLEFMLWLCTVRLCFYRQFCSLSERNSTCTLKRWYHLVSSFRLHIC